VLEIAAQWQPTLPEILTKTLGPEPQRVLPIPEEGTEEMKVKNNVKAGQRTVAVLD
jgi:hypothetical protein